jgi:hypothetical protein
MYLYIYMYVCMYVFIYILTFYQHGLKTKCVIFWNNIYLGRYKQLSLLSVFTLIVEFLKQMKKNKRMHDGTSRGILINTPSWL